MANPHLRLVTPTTENRTVMPRRRKNADLRSREYLTEHEIEALMAAARQNRHGHRDATMILVAFRHGLRAAEAVDLRWDQVDFRTATLHVRRAKKGTPSTHPIARRRAARAAPPSTGARAQVGLRIPLGARRTVYDRRASPAWSNGQGSRPSWASRPIHICSGTPVASRWRTRGMTRGRCRPTLGTAISSTRFVHRVGADAVQEISGDNGFE